MRTGSQGLFRPRRGAAILRTRRNAALLGEGGTTLLEASAALALGSMAAVSMLAGLRPLACAFRVEAARSSLAGVLLEARRSAYESETTVAVEVVLGSSTVTLQPSGAVRGLPDGVTLSSVPSDGDVQFRASGLAENATLGLSCGDSSASLVVNQRGAVR